MGTIEIKKALRFALIGLGINVFLILLTMILYGIYIAYLKDDYSRGVVIFNVIRGVIYWVLYIASILFLIWWLIKTKIAVDPMERGLRKDVNLALGLLVIVSIFRLFYNFILGPAIIVIADFQFPIYHNINSFFNLILLFSFIIVLILPVRRLLSKKEMYLILIGSVVFLATSVSLNRYYSNESVLEISWIIGYVVSMISMVAILIGYILLYQGINERNIGENHYYKSLKNAYQKGGWRKKFTKVTDEYSYSLIGFAAMLLMINSTFGYFSDKDEYESIFDKGNVINIIDRTSESQTGIVERSFENGISEGEDQTISIEMEGEPLNVMILLIWVDESDTVLWENQPDTFELAVDYPGGEDSETNSNPQGGTGEIEMEFVPFWGGELNITVSLVDAGNYQRPFGPRLVERTDNSNIYELTVTIEYPDAPEE